MQNEEGNSASITEAVRDLPLPSVRRSRFEFWTSSQRRSLLCVCVVVLVFLAIESFREPSLISDPPPKVSLRSDEIADRLDPNSADASALAAIPNLGEKRAAEIVEFRENLIRQHPNQIPFSSADDLLRMKGIGVATVASVSPYLTFPHQAATKTRN